jgi:hypothetical protein
MEVLSGRIILRPTDLDRSRRSYRDVLALAIYREFGCAQLGVCPGHRRAVSACCQTGLSSKWLS